MIRSDGFNDDILAASDRLFGDHGGRGYEINSYFTHDLVYGDGEVIPANHAPLTMCVAAAMEVIVEAMQGWYGTARDKSPFAKLPAASWRRGTPTSIRAHVFMYAGTGSNGTAHALERFGIGRVVPFADLRPGDFMNFNRESGSGHACVFLSYLDEKGNDLTSFSPEVAGFRYFSAQGKNSPDAGLGYRWAFFAGKGPARLDGGRRTDRGVIRSSRQSLLCCGYMLHPTRWPARVGLADVQVRTSAARGRDGDAELPLPDLRRFDGATSGDGEAPRGRRAANAKRRRGPALAFEAMADDRNLRTAPLAAGPAVIQDFLPVGFPTRPGTRIRATSITIHNTDNTSPGAGAKAHNRYIRGADAVRRQVSWHFTVDDQSIYQHLPVNEMGYHAGPANASSVAIEICMNPDMNEALAYDRAAQLCAELSAQLGIAVPTGLKQHFDWTGKNCPRVLRSGPDRWKQFTDLVVAHSRRMAAPVRNARARVPAGPGIAAAAVARDDLMLEIDRHFEAHALEAAAIVQARPIPETDPVPFARSGALTRYWPLITRHRQAMEVNTLLANGGVAGSRGGRRFLADRAGGRYHVGLDLFCSQGDPVLAIEDGRIVNFYDFYEGTHALLVAHDGYVANYGEVEPHSLRTLGLAVGSNVRAGQQIGLVGRLDMLHFEAYATGVTANKRWMKADPRPASLRNPSQLLLDLAATAIRLDHERVAVAGDFPPSPLATAAQAGDALQPEAFVEIEPSDWHRFEGGRREWLFDARGIAIRDAGVVSRPRWEESLRTMRSIMDLMGREVLDASAKHGLPPALVLMTIATESHVHARHGFTGPRSFRWEPHVENRDVNPPDDGDYSAGPMQTLATTARWVIRDHGTRFGLAYDPFVVAPHYRDRPVPPPDANPLYAYPANIDIGAAEIRVRLRKTGFDPILVAAAYNSGGLRSTDANPWGLKVTGDHLDRAAKWYGDACALLIEMGIV